MVPSFFLTNNFIRGANMKLKVFGGGKMIPMVVDDDISDKELVRLIQIALTTEQGNGRSQRPDRLKKEA